MNLSVKYSNAWLFSELLVKIFIPIFVEIVSFLLIFYYIFQDSLKTYYQLILIKYLRSLYIFACTSCIVVTVITQITWCRIIIFLLYIIFTLNIYKLILFLKQTSWSKTLEIWRIHSLKYWSIQLIRSRFKVVFNVF